MAVDPLIDAAGAIADGQSPDWTSVTSRLSSDDDRSVADQLAEVARIAAAHHQLHQLLPAAGDVAPLPWGERSRWGHLELLDIVGRGSYGTVYRAWDTRLERLVALKLFHRAPHPDAVMLEGRMLARVRHENVVTVYGADVIDDVAGIWMELVHGRTLDQVVKEQGALAARDAAKIGVDVAKALGAIHGAQLLHCDVKAQNVVRDDTGRVVLMDMGAGRMMPDPSDDQLSDVTGTPRYMAPELFHTGGSATRASDVYSLGVLLYYLVSGRFPVEGKSLGDLKQAHVEGRVTPLADARPGLPAAYLSAVTRALDPVPARRPESAVEVERLLTPAAAPPVRLIAKWQTWALAVAIGIGVLAVVLGRNVITPVAPVRSIAVLPIRNLTGDPAKAYFADGLTDVLISNVARIRSLRVPSFEAVAPFRDRTDRAADVAKQLGAELLLAGSITQADTKFRMTVQLIEPKTGTVRWGEELTRDAAGVISAQAEVARLVADRLALQLGADEQRALKGGAIDPRAMDVFLRGLALRRGRPTEPVEPARLFREATEIDPTFARAWAELALAEIPLAARSANADRSERSALPRQMAERAIQLDPTVVAGYTALGTIQFYDEWNFAAAEQTFRTALTIDPSDGMVRQRFSMLLAARGRLDEAIVVAQECARLEPSIPIRFTSLGQVYYYARDFARARSEFQHALAISPGFPLAYFGLGLVAGAQGRYDEAIANVQRAIAGSDYVVWQIDLARLYAAAGRTVERDRILAALSDRAKAGEAYAIDNLGYIAAAEGRIDDAFHYLDQAVVSRTTNVLWMMVDPRVDPLRSDPRFSQLLTKAGLRQ